METEFKLGLILDLKRKSLLVNTPNVQINTSVCCQAPTGEYEYYRTTGKYEYNRNKEHMYMYLSHECSKL